MFQRLGYFLKEPISLAFLVAAILSYSSVDSGELEVGRASAGAGTLAEVARSDNEEPEDFGR